MNKAEAFKQAVLDNSDIIGVCEVSFGRGNGKVYHYLYPKYRIKLKGGERVLVPVGMNYDRVGKGIEVDPNASFEVVSVVRTVPETDLRRDSVPSFIIGVVPMDEFLATSNFIKNEAREIMEMFND